MLPDLPNLPNLHNLHNLHNLRNLPNLPNLPNLLTCGQTRRSRQTYTETLTCAWCVCDAFSVLACFGARLSVVLWVPISMGDTASMGQDGIALKALHCRARSRLCYPSGV